MEKIIELISASKIYTCGKEKIYALDDVSFTAYRGEFIVIIGQSGSGKSTMLNILGCLDTPTEGELKLFGKDVRKYNEAKMCQLRNRNIGFIFQSFNLIPTLTARENVELPLLYRGLSPKERREIAEEALAKVGLVSRAEHRPFELSGGQQQRVAVARAAAANPPLILADEPTGNLDSSSRQEVMHLLYELNSKGNTVVLITHDNEIAGNAPKVVRIKDGKIV